MTEEEKLARIQDVLGGSRSGLLQKVSSALEGASIQDARLVLAVLVAFSIDASEDKRESYNWVMNVIDTLISVDKGPYRKGGYEKSEKR